MNSENKTPRVSCLMVTADRVHLAERAVQCFVNQTYPDKELVIVDDGSQDYTPILAGIPDGNINYIRLEKDHKNVLGRLRNLALDHASGEYLVQWDDDDWYHPRRLEVQAKYLKEGYDACCLGATLMHLDDPFFVELPFLGKLPDGVPGSIMHRKKPAIRYPEYSRAEDTVYLKEWKRQRYRKLSPAFAWLFIRCYHGANTWEYNHFTRRIRNNVKDWLYFLYHNWISGDLSKHPNFLLSLQARQAFELYLEESRRLGLLKSERSG